MNTQDQPTPSGHPCRRCGYPFTNANPSSELRRAHNRVCGTIQGYTKLIVDDSEPVFDSDSDSDDQQHEKTPSPKIEKRIVKESGSSADRFSDAVTELSDAGISPGVVSEVKKVDEQFEVFESSISHSKDADKAEEHDSDTKHSDPLFVDSDGSHKDNIIDQMEPSATVQIDNKDQGKDVYELSVQSDIPLVDKADTLIEDFKDHKRMFRDGKHGENKPVVDVFKVKTVQETVHESQTSESVVTEESKAAETNSLETSKTVPESADNRSEAEASYDPVMSLGERIAAEIRKTETDHSAQKTVQEPKSAVSSSKDSLKVGTSESLVDEGSGKRLTGQESGVDASFASSSRNSLEGNWGSVLSELSDVFGKSQVSDDRSRLGRSDAFDGVSFTESEQETSEQEASKVKAVKVQKSQPAKSEEAIAKVTNWSTSGQIATTPLRKLMSGATSSSPKPSSNMSKKDGDPGKSTLTRAPKVNQASSSVKDSGEGEKVKKKPKGWARFICCYMPDTK